MTLKSKKWNFIGQKASSRKQRLRRRVRLDPTLDSRPAHKTDKLNSCHLFSWPKIQTLYHESVICWKITDLLCHNFFTHLVWSCAYRKNCEDISARNFPLLSRVTKKLCWLYSSVTIVTRLLIFFMWKRLISSKAAIKAQAASELTSSYDGHDTIYGATWWNLLGSITWPFLEGGTLFKD